MSEPESDVTEEMSQPESELAEETGLDVNLALKDDMYHDQLLTAVQCLASGSQNVHLVSVEGHKIYTHKSILCLHSRLLYNLISDIPCCINTGISVPITSKVINNLLRILVTGTAVAYHRRELEDVRNAAKILGIDLGEIEIETKDLEKESIVTVEVNGAKDIRALIEIGETYEDIAVNDEVDTNEEAIETQNEREKVICDAQTVDSACAAEHAGKKTEGSDYFDTNSNSNSNSFDEVVFDQDGAPIIHNGEVKKEVECMYCGQRFSRIDHLKRHMKHHTGEKPFTCDICYKSFSRKDKMQLHRSVHHAEMAQAIPKYECTVCGESYKSLSWLMRHMKEHNQKTVNTSFPYQEVGFPEPVKFPEPAQFHQCEYCNKAFAKRNGLVLHMKTHEKKPNDGTLWGGLMWTQPQM